MATRQHVVITVKTEFYDVIEDYNTGNFLVQDNTLSLGDTALLHLNVGEAVGIYRGDRTTRRGTNYAVLEPDNRTVATAIVNSGAEHSVLFRVLEPRQRTVQNKVKSFKLAKPSKVMEESAYYIFNYDITPIDTNITINSVATPINPIKPPRINKELLRSYTDLYDQVQDALDIYQIIKNQAQCSTDITLEQAVKCNKLLRKAIY